MALNVQRNMRSSLCHYLIDVEDWTLFKTNYKDMSAFFPFLVKKDTNIKDYDFVV